MIHACLGAAHMDISLTHVHALPTTLGCVVNMRHHHLPCLVTQTPASMAVNVITLTIHTPVHVLRDLQELTVK